MAAHPGRSEEGVVPVRWPLRSVRLARSRLPYQGITVCEAHCRQRFETALGTPGVPRL